MVGVRRRREQSSCFSQGIGETCVLRALLGTWLIINLIGAMIVGALARAILPGKDKVGWPLTIAHRFWTANKSQATATGPRNS